MVSHRVCVVVDVYIDVILNRVILQLVRVQSRNGTKRITAEPTDTLRKFLDKVQKITMASQLTWSSDVKYALASDIFHLDVGYCRI